MSYINGIGNAQPYAGSLDTVAPASASRLSSVTATGAGSNEIAPSRSASVSITAGLLTGALSGSDVRIDRVSSLQQLIAVGSYSVPASMVATRMMSGLLS
jgi:anti-sigma28 factor (negative regulator of flagellin synthesis)